MIGLRHLASQWAASIAVAGISLGLTFVLARLMGPDAFGVYNSAITIGALVALVQDCGFKTLIFRERTAPTPGREGHHIEAQAVGHVALVTGITVMVGAVWGGVLVVLALLSSAGKVLASFVSSRLKAAGSFGEDARWQTWNRLATALGALGGWLVSESIAGLLLGLLAGQVAVLLLPAARHSLAPPRFRLWPELYGNCVAILVIDAATTVYFRSDIVMLQAMGRSAGEIGLYSAAYKLLEGAIFFLAPVSALLFRHLRLHGQPNEGAGRDPVWSQVALATLAGAVLAGGVGALGALPVTLVYGDSYAGAGALMPWLFASLGCILPNMVLTQAFLARNREWEYAASATAAAIANLGLNALLIPELGAVGSAQATFATEAVLMVGLMVLLVRRR